MANDKFGAKEVLDVTLYNMGTGAPFISFDTLKTSSISVTNEKVYARGGRGNPKLITWEYGKEGTLTIEDALLSPKSLELVSGLAKSTGSQTIYMRQNHEYDTTGDTPKDKGAIYPLTCSSAGVINLGYTPKETAANIYVYLASDDCGTRVDMAGATLSTNTLTLGANGITAAGGNAVIVYYSYDSASTSETFIIDAEHFAGTYRLVGKTVVRNYRTGMDEEFQVVLPNLKFSSNLELSFAAEGDPSVQSYECEIQKSNNGELIRMTKI